MAFGNLLAIGPVPVTYRDPKLSFSGDPTTHGISACSIGGLIEHNKAQQLRELVNNPTDRMTVGGFTGILEYVDFDGDTMSAFAGWYLLQSFEIQIEQQWSIHGVSGLTPFSLSAVFLGDAP